MDCAGTAACHTEMVRRQRLIVTHDANTSDCSLPTDNKPVAKPDLSLAPPKPVVLHHVSLEKSLPVISANKFDDETMEDEHNLPTVDIKKSSHVSHMSVSKLHIQEQVERGEHLWVPTGRGKP